MNPIGRSLVHLRTHLALRADALKDGEKRGAGASAIEWAIITGLLALIAIAIGATIEQAIQQAADNIQVAP